VIIIRYKYHETFQRIRLAPDWVFYLCSLLGLVASGFGVYVTFTGPWTPLISYGPWVLWIGGIGVLSLIIGAVIFFVGQATIKSDVTDEEVIAEATGGRATA
jgi:glutamate:GABA antiporter